MNYKSQVRLFVLLPDEWGNESSIKDYELKRNNKKAYFAQILTTSFNHKNKKREQEN